MGLPRTEGEPGTPAFTLVRTRLADELLSDERHPIVSMVAPPGYGKTILLGRLFRAEREAGNPAVWLEPAPGLTLAQVLAEQLGGKQDLSADDAIVHVQLWVQAQDTRLTLFIDRFEEFGELVEDNWFDALLRQAPSVIRWRLASRCPLPIDRLEHLLEGRLREVNYPQLSMSPRESRELLGPAVCQHLEAQDFDFLQEITEGWPASLRIIAARLATSDHPRSLLRTFAEPQPDFASYFDSRLLARLSDEERTLLFELAMLPEFDSELCLRVSQVEEPLSKLARLQQANRIAQAPSGSGALSLHPLIAIHCRSRARIHLDEAHRIRILSTAAEWFESRALWDRAIEVHMLAGEVARVVDLLEQCSELLVSHQGQLMAFTRWIELLQSRGTQPGPQAHFWYLWALIFRRRYGLAELQVGALQQHLARAAKTDDEAGRLLSQVPLIRACIAIYSDRIQETNELASKWLEAHPDGDPFHVGEAYGLQALAHIDASRFGEARRALSHAHASFGQSGSRYGLGWMQMFDAIITLREGDVLTARRELRAVMESLRADLGDDVPLLASMELTCARCSLDQGLDEEAESLLVSGLRLAQIHGHLDPLVYGVEVGIALWMGRDDEASLIQQLRGLANGYPSRLALMLNCYRILALLRLGRLDEAREQAFDIGLDPEHLNPRFDLEEVIHDNMCRHLYAGTHIRLAIAFSCFERAAKLLEREMPIAREQNRVGDQIGLLLDSMIISVRSANNKLARQQLHQAVCLAARRRFLRPFRERLDSIAPLVLHTRLSDWAWADAAEKQFFALLCRELPMEGAQLLEALEEVGVEPELAGTITHREIELLRLIHLGLSNTQIAMRFELSVSTVKWHLYNLFSKLGAKSRSAAVARAKALNLIS